ncbi:hypothetical protein RJ55_02189 [Drechmeria coniospora]|nr:hypothetical protein RJ55_02189 [Drechmeria coniospora]
MGASGCFQWAVVLALTAVVLSLVVIAQVLATYSAAYAAAPREMVTFVDAVDFSVQENESYDRDVAGVRRLEDKIRLGRLLREIQRAGDDLRERLDDLLVDGSATTLRTGPRLLWASRRRELEDGVRRLDMLRMRFLVVHMAIVGSAAAAAAAGPRSPPSSSSPPPPPPPLPPTDAEKTAAMEWPRRCSVPRSLASDAAKRPLVRRLTTQAVGHSETVTSPHRKGWAGVVEELQLSPRMQQRHASIEQAMRGQPR